MYQNALIAEAPSIDLSTSSTTTFRAHSTGHLPRWNAYKSTSTGINLNVDYPKWMYSPPVFKRRKVKPQRNFIEENKRLAANPYAILDYPPSPREPDACDTSTAAMAESAYENFMRLMRNRTTAFTKKIPCKWTQYTPTVPAEIDPYSIPQDAEERKLLEFAHKVPGECWVSKNGECDLNAPDAPDIDADTDAGDADATDDTQQPKTFMSELLDDAAFTTDVFHAKDRVDSRMNPTAAPENLAQSPFGQPIAVQPSYRYEKGNRGEELVLVWPERTACDSNDSKFLYSEEELAKITTSKYSSFLLRKQEDLYRAPYLIPYTFRSSRI